MSNENCRKNLAEEIRIQRISLEHAPAHFAALIAGRWPGEVMELVGGENPVAKLVVIEPATHQPVFGRAQGRISIAPDFDESPEELREYTE